MASSDLLKDRNPELLEEWDYDANSHVNLDSLKSSSSISVSWICRINPKHKWKSKVRSRAIDGHGCHYCKGKKVLREESFAAKHPDMLEQWDANNNEGIDPWSLSEHSNKKINWRCLENLEHTWSSSISGRVRYNSGCPHCSRHNKTHRITGDKSLVANFPRIAREWHPTLNAPVKATDVSYGSARRVWWQCAKNKEHVWDATVTSRTSPEGGKCPFCTGITVSEQNSLAALYPDVAKDWHPTKNNGLTPDKVKKASGKKAWWKCSKNPTHEWEAIIRNRTLLKSGCPICDAETRYFRLSNSQFDTSGTGTNYHKVFSSSIHNIRKMLQSSNFSGSRLEQPFLRMNYAAAITALETYLSDAFYDSVINSDERLNRLFTTDPEFKARKFSIAETILWAQSYKDKASEHLQTIVWHNLARVAHLYGSVLSITVPINDEDIHKAISIRHDIVHRNGRTKSGRPLILKESEVENILVKISDYVSFIDKQLAIL